MLTEIKSCPKPTHKQFANEMLHFRWVFASKLQIEERGEPDSFS